MQAYACFRIMSAYAGIRVKAGARVRREHDAFLTGCAALAGPKKQAYAGSCGKLSRGVHMIEKAPSRAGSGCHCTALRKASRRVTQLYDMALAPSGLKITQRAILAQIGRSEAASVSTLAEAMVMDAGGLAHTLKPLIRDRLVSLD